MVDQPPSYLYLVVLGAYVLVMLVLGFFANRKVHTVEDYLVAGRKLPFILAVPTMVAAWYGTGFCMGVSGLVYAEGIPAVLADPFGSTLALIFAGLFFASRFRRMRLLTVADILGRAYGKRIEICASALMMPFYIGTLAAQMVALGYLLHLFAHVDTNTAIVVGSILMAVYTMAGGMWAVSFTDFIQLTVLLFGMILIFPTVFQEFQDPNTFSLLKEEFVALLPHKQEAGKGLLVYLGQIAITGIGAIMGQDLVQRCLATRSERTARWSALTAGVLYFALGMLPIAIGVAGRSLVPGLETPELLIPQLAQKYLSPLLVVVFVGGLILAIMSTSDSYLLAGTSILTLNVVLPIMPLKSETSRLWLLRGCSLLMTFAAYLLAITGFNIFQLVIHSGAMLFVAVFVPVTMTMFYKRATAQAAWCSLLGGVGCWLVFMLTGFFFLEMTGDSILYASATVGGLGSLVIYMFVTWLTATKAAELSTVTLQAN